MFMFSCLGCALMISTEMQEETAKCLSDRDRHLEVFLSKDFC